MKDVDVVGIARSVNGIPVKDPDFIVEGWTNELIALKHYNNSIYDIKA